MEHNILNKKIQNIKQMAGLQEIEPFKTEDIKFIDLSLTSRCNLKCPLCRRQMFPEEKIGKIDINLEMLKTKVFTRERTKNYEKMIICGNFGDPIMYPQIDEFLEHIIDVGPHLWLQINTNGSMRKTEWWANLGKLFSGLNFAVQFGIDGLEDTHSKYRVGSDFKTVMKHMETYVENGGKAVWQFLLFDYNEHQIPEASKICEKLGIKLQPMISYKYDNLNIKNQPEGFKRPKGLKTQTHGNNDHQIEAAANIGYTTTARGFHKPSQWKPSYTSVLSCITVDEQGIYIDESGNIVPCCFTHPKNERYFSEIQVMQMKKEKDKLNLNNSTIEEAINTDFFKQTVNNRGTNTLCNFFCGRKQRFLVDKR
jgi:MoaA/NifB/PqqE/SkfB family radical SAM enzyme